MTKEGLSQAMVDTDQSELKTTQTNQWTQRVENPRRQQDAEMEIRQMTMRVAGRQSPAW